MSQLDEIPKVSYSDLTLDNKVWRYWPEDYSNLAQNHAYLVRKNEFCTIGHVWCGSVSTPEYLQEECSKYDMNGDGPNNTHSSCCRAYRSNKWYKLSCINTTDWGKNDTPESNLTLSVIKESGIGCEAGSCIPKDKDIIYPDSD